VFDTGGAEYQPEHLLSCEIAIQQCAFLLGRDSILLTVVQCKSGGGLLYSIGGQLELGIAWLEAGRIGAGVTRHCREGARRDE
jgi:hypothetical protein